MADKLTQEYIMQMFHGSICMYKGIPVFFSSINAELSVVYYELVDQKKRVAKFSLEHFTSPSARLGMVNVMDGAVWTSRLPVRRYSVGINRDNFRVSSIPGAAYPSSAQDAVYRIQGRNCPEIGHTLLGEFPSFAEAFAQAKESDGTCAFDRQFAVDNEGYIYYKMKQVGKVKKGCEEVLEEHLEERYKYLSIILSGDYVKNS